MRQKHTLIAIVAVLSTCPLIAQMATWKPGDTLIYEHVTQTQISGGHLPPQAYAPQPPATSSLRVTITSLDPDGTALTHVVIDRPFPEKEIASKLGGGPLAAARNNVILSSSRKTWEEQNRYKEFDARLTPEGALLAAIDNTPQHTTEGMSPAQLRDQMVAEVQSPEYQAKLAANEFDGTFRLPNAVALSCGKRKSIAPGDFWRVTSKADGAAYDVTVSGKQSYRGRDVIVLDSKSHAEHPNISADTEATVYYDPQAHLIVGAHSVTNSDVQATGMKSTTTSDLNLKQ